MFAVNVPVEFVRPLPIVTSPKSPSASAPTNRVGVSVVKFSILTAPATWSDLAGAFVKMPIFPPDSKVDVLTPEDLNPVPNNTPPIFIAFVAPSGNVIILPMIILLEPIPLLPVCAPNKLL